MRVVLDGGTTLRVRPEDLAALNLRPGDRVEPEVLERLQAADTAVRGKEIAYRLLAVRMRSRRELADRLHRRGILHQTAEGLLDALEREGLIDDARFAAAWVRGRLALRPSGAARLRQELLRKGVSRDDIGRALGEMLSVRGEEELALTVASKRLPRYRGLPPKVAYRRLGGLLARRGFSAGVVAGVLRRVLGAAAEQGEP